MCSGRCLVCRTRCHVSAFLGIRPILRCLVTTARSLITAARSPESARRCPVSVRRCPVSVRRCPVSELHCPVSARRCPVSGRRCSVSACCFPVTRARRVGIAMLPEVTGSYRSGTTHRQPVSAARARVRTPERAVLRSRMGVSAPRSSVRASRTPGSSTRSERQPCVCTVSCLRLRRSRLRPRRSPRNARMFEATRGGMAPMCGPTRDRHRDRTLRRDRTLPRAPILPRDRTPLLAHAAMRNPGRTAPPGSRHTRNAIHGESIGAGKHAINSCAGLAIRAAGRATSSITSSRSAPAARMRRVTCNGKQSKKQR